METGWVPFPSRCLRWLRAAHCALGRSVCASVCAFACVPLRVCVSTYVRVCSCVCAHARVDGEMIRNAYSCECRQALLRMCRHIEY